MRIFPYFGSKTKLAKLYPEPIHDVIIEPFAGAAAYSQLYWQKKVYLTDTSKTIVSAWQYIINSTKADIEALPGVKYQDDVFSFNIPYEAQCLLSLYNFDGFARQGRRVGRRCIWNKMRKNLAETIHRFRHWEVALCSFDVLNDCENEATWFIDPPYQFGGENYEMGQPDFQKVADFCKSRSGQVIVCENTKANWLPFKPLAVLHGIKHTTTEAIWLKGCAKAVCR